MNLCETSYNILKKSIYNLYTKCTHVFMFYICLSIQSLQPFICFYTLLKEYFIIEHDILKLKKNIFLLISLSSRLDNTQKKNFWGAIQYIFFSTQLVLFTCTHYLFYG